MICRRYRVVRLPGVEASTAHRQGCGRPWVVQGDSTDAEGWVDVARFLTEAQAAEYIVDVQARQRALTDPTGRR